MSLMLALIDKSQS